MFRDEIKKGVKVGTPFPWYNEGLEVVNVTDDCVTLIEPRSFTGIVLEDENLVEAVVKWCAKHKVKVPVIE